jgi:hypothetical protein
MCLPAENAAASSQLTRHNRKGHVHTVIVLISIESRGSTMTSEASATATEKDELLRKIAALVTQLMSEQNTGGSTAILIRGNMKGSYIGHNYSKGMDKFLDVQGSLEDSNVSSNTIIGSDKSELISALRKLYALIQACDNKSQEGSRLAKWFNQKFPKYASIGSLGLGITRFFV